MSKEKFKFDGLDEYIATLHKMADANQFEDAIGSAIYVGADIVADAIRKEIEAIPTRPPNLRGSPEHKLSGLLAVQKRALLNSLGITSLRETAGIYDVKIGFDGYNSVVTKTWKKGQPNSMIARSIESGTSWLSKTSFMTKAINSSKAKAEKEMAIELDNQIKKIMEE